MHQKNNQIWKAYEVEDAKMNEKATEKKKQSKNIKKIKKILEKIIKKNENDIKLCNFEDEDLSEDEYYKLVRGSKCGGGGNVQALKKFRNNIATLKCVQVEQNTRNSYRDSKQNMLVIKGNILTNVVYNYKITSAEINNFII